jgi:acyl-coenzyme A thioesterase 13
MNPIVEYFKLYIDKELGPEFPPFTKWLGGVLRKVEEGELEVGFIVRPEMTNPVGLLHGGVQNAIIDDVIGMSVATVGHETFFLSLNLYVDYLGKAKVGEKIVAKSKIFRSGKRIVNAQCDLLDIEGNIISRGTSNLLKSNIPAFSGSASK